MISITKFLQRILIKACSKVALNCKVLLLLYSGFCEHVGVRFRFGINGVKLKCYMQTAIACATVGSIPSASVLLGCFKKTNLSHIL